MARPRKNDKRIRQARAYVTDTQYVKLQRYASENNISISIAVNVAITQFLEGKRDKNVVTEQSASLDVVVMAKQLVKEMQASGLMVVAANNSTNDDNSNTDDDNNSETIKNTDLTDFINDFDFGL